MTYPMTLNLNFGEILRALDALQVSPQDRAAMPANWASGQDAIIPSSVSDEGATSKFGDFTTHLPSLRTTKQLGVRP